MSPDGAGPSAASTAPYCVLELYATPQHDDLAATFRALPASAPLAPLRQLIRDYPLLFVDDTHGHDIGWGLLRSPERPFLVLRAKWRSLTDLDRIVAALNASRIHELVIRLHKRSASPSASPPQDTLTHFFDTLSIAGLYGLVLQDYRYDTGGDFTPAVGGYLASPRSQSLERLYILQSEFAQPDFAAPILDAITATGRVSTLRLGGAAMSWEDEFRPPVRMREGWFAPSPLVNRLPSVTGRNAALVRAVRRAAAQVLIPARVLLRGRPSTQPHDGTRPFPILDLPHHVLVNILRYTAHDAALLSDPQLARLCAHAASSTALTALCSALADLQRPRKVGGDLVPPDRYATLLADADNSDPEAVIAQRIASVRLRTVIIPAFEDVMERWLAAGGFHVE
ncbi:uncharacterized protein LOC62_04G005383 [Vanrija pseudolonga]|uniref:Uncharacterized protein n=1 Tax=Vanrija pseudolonga TaxID=143232 RepID=A0AAF1BIR4_9TREE|nr:hypothetical protein LOC62_04G005383 [Vanrija pseudolonga]